MDAAFLIRSLVLVCCFCLSFWALSALRFERCLKANHVRQAQVLYWLLAMALGYLASGFILSFLYRL